MKTKPWPGAHLAACLFLAVLLSIPLCSSTPARAGASPNLVGQWDGLLQIHGGTLDFHLTIGAQRGRRFRGNAAIYPVRGTVDAGGHFEARTSRESGGGAGQRFVHWWTFVGQLSKDEAAITGTLTSITVHEDGSREEHSGEFTASRS